MCHEYNSCRTQPVTLSDYLCEIRIGDTLVPQLFYCAMQDIFSVDPKVSERFKNKLTNSVCMNELIMLIYRRKYNYSK
jgi:hypothetical protein